jgi:hypothetical protein
MAIHISWDSPDELAIRYTYYSNWAWDDFYVASQQVTRLVEKRKRPYGEIILLPSPFRLPDNIYSHLRQTLMEVSVVVGLPSIAESIHQTFQAIHPNLNFGFRSARSHDEARAIIEAILGASTSRG